MTSSYLLNKHPSLNGERCSLWKEKMKFFIKGMDHGILKVMKKGLFVPMHKIDVVLVNKPEKDWTKVVVVGSVKSM